MRTAKIDRGPNQKAGKCKAKRAGKNKKKEFLDREFNPGLSGESRLS